LLGGTGETIDLDFNLSLESSIENPKSFAIL
jgi:hypothetical protein